MQTLSIPSSGWRARAKPCAALATLALLCANATPAAAYTVDAKTQTVSISSLADFDKCQREFGGGDPCLDALKVYTKKHPKEAFDAGKLVRLNYTHWAALDFFAQALSKPPTKERCADEDLRLAVVSGLALPAGYPGLAVAQKIAAGACWEQLQPSLVKGLDDGGGHYRDNLCPLLTEKNVTAAGCKAPVAPPPKAAAPSAASVLKGVDWKTLSIDADSARALRGSNGEEVLIANSKPGSRKLYLLKFKNVQGPWNGKVFVSYERPSGLGHDYVVAPDQNEWVALTEREGRFEAHIKGAGESIALYPARPVKTADKPPTQTEIANEFAASKTAK